MKYGKTGRARKRLMEYRQGQVREEEIEYGGDYDDEHEHEEVR